MKGIFLTGEQVKSLINTLDAATRTLHTPTAAAVQRYDACSQIYTSKILLIEKQRRQEQTA